MASVLEIRSPIHCEFITVCSHRRVVKRNGKEGEKGADGTTARTYLYTHGILTSVLGVWSILSHQAQGRVLEGLMEGSQEDDR